MSRYVSGHRVGLVFGASLRLGMGVGTNIYIGAGLYKSLVESLSGTLDEGLDASLGANLDVDVGRKGVGVMNWICNCSTDIFISTYASSFCKHFEFTNCKIGHFI